MKTRHVQTARSFGAAQRTQQAFTLIEIMVAMAIFTLVMIGTIYSHLFGLKMRQITSSKLGASDEARTAISKLTEEIRAASWIEVGNVGTDGSVLTNFMEIEPGEFQQGNAIKIMPILNNSNVFSIYYWETNWFKKITNGASANASFVIAHSISNQMIFTSEDYLGHTNLTQSGSRLISMTLSFYQLQYPTVEIGPGQFYDFYQLRTKITRRSTQ